MGQILLQDNIPDLAIATTTTITMAATYLGKDTRITIGGQQYRYTSTTTINFATTGINALDTGTIASNTLYYIYAVVNGGGTIGLVASTASPTTGPTGFTRWKEIGRCRTFFGSTSLAVVTNRDNNFARNAATTSWSTYVPSTITGLTATTNLRTRRVGESQEVEGILNVTGTNATECRVTMPTLGVGTTSMTSANTSIFQAGIAVSNNGATQYPGVLVQSNISYFTFGRIYLTEVMFSNLLGNAFTSGTSTVGINARYPVAEYVGLYT